VYLMETKFSKIFKENDKKEKQNGKTGFNRGGNKETQQARWRD